MYLCQIQYTIMYLKLVLYNVVWQYSEYQILISSLMWYTFNVYVAMLNCHCHSEGQTKLKNYVSGIPAWSFFLSHSVYSFSMRFPVIFRFAIIFISMKLLDYRWELCSYSCVPIVMNQLSLYKVINREFVLSLLDSRLKL